MIVHLTRFLVTVLAAASRTECAGCVCGQAVFTYQDYQDHGKRCRVEEEGDGVCSEGIVISNDHQDCDYVHFSCDNSTVNKYEMRQDRTDVEQCRASSPLPGSWWWLPPTLQNLRCSQDRNKQHIAKRRSASYPPQ